MEEQKVLVLVKPPTFATHELITVTSSSELDVFAAASSDGSVYVWNLELGQAEGTCVYRTYPIYLMIDLHSHLHEYESDTTLHSHHHHSVHSHHHHHHHHHHPHGGG